MNRKCYCIICLVFPVMSRDSSPCSLISFQCVIRFCSFLYSSWKVDTKVFNGDLGSWLQMRLLFHTLVSIWLLIVTTIFKSVYVSCWPFEEMRNCPVWEGVLSRDGFASAVCFHMFVSLVDNVWVVPGPCEPWGWCTFTIFLYE